MLLGGEARSCLAATRSLGLAGYKVIVCSEKKHCLSSVSKYSHNSLAYPSPLHFKEEFQSWLSKIVLSEKPDWLIPLTDTNMEAVLEIEAELRASTQIPTVSNELFSKVSDKSALLELANELGLNTPKTISPDTATVSEIKSFPYPAVLKPQSSAKAGANRKILYPTSAEEVINLIKENKGFILQQKISGVGVGVFAICKDGKTSSLFCHKRLLEKPPSGGVSVLSESISPEEAPVEHASKLLQELNWQGVAMVEFKKHTDGKFYLMEINPRFWGSLQLAVFSGVDFPKLLLSAKEEQTSSYQYGLRLRWLLGSFDHLLIRLKKEGIPKVFPIISKNSLQISLSKKTSFDVFRLSDIKPFLFELKNWFWR